MRSRWAGAAAFAAVVTLACTGSGCAVISTGGSPASLLEVGEGDPLSVPFQRMVAIEPQASWTPEQVARGLQAAMASFDDPRREILRRYLTPEAQRTWKPGGPVTVLEDGVRFVSPSKGDGKTATVVLEGTEIAVIDDDGRYVPARKKTIRSFDLVKGADGGYLVSRLDNGLVLTAADVRRAYRPVNLYFLNGTADADGVGSLVVDPVRLRIDPHRTFAETIVERLLGGPSSALKGAVNTAFPTGTRVESIKPLEDVVVINLAGDFSDRPADSALAAQLQWSLRDVAKGRTIEVKLNGEPFYDSGTLQISPKEFDNWVPAPDETVYYVADGRVHMMNRAGTGATVAGTAGQKKNDTYTDPALSAGGRFLAVKAGENGIWGSQVGSDAPWKEWIKGTDLTSPTWNMDGSLWVVDRTAPNASHVIRYDKDDPVPQTPIKAADLESTWVDRFEVARDGVRVAAVVRHDDGMSVQVGAIVGTGATQRLDHFQTLLTTVEKKQERVLDLAWRDAAHLLVLVGSKAGATVMEVSIGDGKVTPVTSDKRITSITALGERMLAGTADDEEAEVLEFDGTKREWETKAKGGRWPAFSLG